MQLEFFIFQIKEGSIRTTLWRNDGHFDIHFTPHLVPVSPLAFFTRDITTVSPISHTNKNSIYESKTNYKLCSSGNTARPFH